MAVSTSNIHASPAAHSLPIFYPLPRPVPQSPDPVPSNLSHASVPPAPTLTRDPPTSAIPGPPTLAVPDSF